MFTGIETPICKGTHQRKYLPGYAKTYSLKKGNRLNKRNLIVLSLSAPLAVSGVAIVVLIGGIIGVEMAPSNDLATLPSSLLVVGLALMTIPAAMIMKRIGRRWGFFLSAMVALAGALLGFYAVINSSFVFFCLAALLIGSNSAYVQQFRFAAVENVEPRFAGRAVSLVLVGSLLAGFFGPEIAKRSKDLLGSAEYAGSFLVLAVLYLILMGLMFFYKNLRQDPNRDPEEVKRELGEERPLRQIITNPPFIAAVLAGTVAYGVMSLIMTATPVHMHYMSGYSLDDTAFVIQSHIIGMYLPSLFSGFLLERFGTLRVILAGIGAMLVCIFLGVTGSTLPIYWAALVLLGIGWNFMFVGATVLLSRNYYPAERFKAQAFNDFTIFGTQALLSLSAGVLLFRASWDILNLIALPLIGLVLVVVLLSQRKPASKPVEVP